MDRGWAVRLAVLALVCAPAAAGEIYRWVDEAGRVHYGDRPVDDQAREVNITPPPPADEAAGQRRRAAQQKLLKVLDEEREQQRAAAAKAAQERERREYRCRQAKAKLAVYQRGGRVYVLGADGKRRFLGDAEIVAGIASWGEQAARWCD